MTPAAALERLELAGVAPRMAPRGRTWTAADVGRRGESILALCGLDRPADAQALGASVAAALPGLATSPAGRAGTSLLLEAVAAGDAGACGRAATALAGLGPGLTPAGDDLLAGVAATVATLGEAAGFDGPRRAAWLAAIAHPAVVARTTPLSARLLELAAEGSAMEPVLGLLDLSPAGDRKLATHVGDLRRLGHSTGSVYALAVGATAWTLGREALDITTTGGPIC